MSLTRRSFLGGAAACVAASLLPAVARAAPALPAHLSDSMAVAIAGAGGEGSPEPMRPYDVIDPAVAEDLRIVRSFFSYTCPHCQSFHNGLAHWGESLPAPLTYQATPIITDPNNANQISAVYGRLICQALAPEKLPGYDYALFRLILGEPGAPTPRTEVTPEQVLSELAQLGLDPEAIRAFVEEQDNIERINDQIVELAMNIPRYSIQATPSVAIMGKVIVNPDHANGNPQQFVQLLNGLVSHLISA